MSNTNEPTVSKFKMTPIQAVSLALIMGFAGAFFWAIRGTTGFGGSQGAALAGLGWAMVWYVFSHLVGQADRRPYGGMRTIAAITFGVTVGGFTGYGVYVAWVQGIFYLNHPEGVREVSAWTGYLALFLCGLHWGGNAGAILAWCAPRRSPGLNGWLLRIGAGIAGYIVAALIVRLFPQFFLPFYSEGIYEIEANRTCQRAVGSIRNVGPFVGLFLGFLVFEIYRRDWRAVAVMLIMSLGFALSFSIGGYWHTFHGSGIGLGWWKHWEMSIGLGGGLAYGLVFILFNRPMLPEARPEPSLSERLWGAAFPIWLVTGFTVANVWQGLVNLHGFDWSASHRIAVVLVYLVPASALLWRWLRSNAAQLPKWAPAHLLIFITVAGYIVSLPPSLNMKQYVLLATYTVFLVAGAEFFMLVFAPARPDEEQ